MSEFLMNCPKCGQAMTVQQEWIGRDVSCPFCKQTFTVQESTIQPVAPAAQASDAPATQAGDAPLTPVEADPEKSWLASLDLATIAKRLKQTFWGYFIIGFGLGIVSLILLVLGLLGLLFGKTNDSNTLAIIGGVIFGVSILLLIVVGILSSAVWLMHHYYVWKLLRPWDRPAGPLATVLFLLIPFFNAYWIFKSIGIQGTLLENEMGQQAKTTRIFAFAFCILNAAMYFRIILAILAMIPYIGILFTLLSQLINLALIVASCGWFILVHKTAMKLVDIRSQAQAAL